MRLSRSHPGARLAPHVESGLSPFSLLIGAVHRQSLDDVINQDATYREVLDTGCLRHGHVSLRVVCK